MQIGSRVGVPHHFNSRCTVEALGDVSNVLVLLSPALHTQAAACGLPFTAHGHQCDNAPDLTLFHPSLHCANVFPVHALDMCFY
jgi:hypothetical protein